MTRSLQTKLWVVFVLLVVALTLPHSVVCSTSGGRVAINQIVTSADTFPQVDLRVAVLDSQGVPVSGLSKGNFEVLENDIKVALSTVEETSAGVRTSLVLDMGKWINNAPFNQKPVKEAMRNVALAFVESMRNGDEAEVVVVYDKMPQVVQPFTSDKERLREVIYGLNWDNRQYSYGLEGIKRAAADLTQADNELPKTILFLSAGIMQRDVMSTDENKIAQQLQAHNIPVFSIYFPWKDKDSDAVYRIQWFPQQTGGLFVRRVAQGDEDRIMDVLNRYRIQYHLAYRSPNGKDAERKVVVGYQGMYATASYTVDPQWLSPAQVEIVVNEGEPVWRKAESPQDDVHEIPMTSAPVKITIEGLGNRQLREAYFYINGAQVPVTRVGPITFTATWDLSSITDEGDNPMLLEFVAEDELGITSQGKATVVVNVVPPLALNPVCGVAAKIPLAGNTLGKGCMALGVNWITLILLAAVVVLAVVLWRKRETVAEVSRDLGVRATNVVKRLTNRLQKMEPKAKLEIVRGLPEGARTELNVFGETTIGRSHEHANLVLENTNVSRLHCVLHEEMNGGWTIEDQDSANGTFLNGKQLPPYKPVPLQEGARIELAPVEYGGVEMIFHILNEPLDDLFAGEDELLEEDPLLTMDIDSDLTASRETSRLESDEFTFDPNDEANLRY